MVALVGRTLRRRRHGGITEFEQRLAHDFKRSAARFIAVFDEREGGRYCRPQGTHKQVSRLRNGNVRDDRHAQSRLHGGFERFDGAQVHRWARQR
jgi:hypothetical protein